MLGPHPQEHLSASCLALIPTDNEVMLYRYRKGGGGGGGGGGVIAREIVASRVQAPPAFCTEAKVAKGGAYLRDTTVKQNRKGLSAISCSLPRGANSCC